MDRILEGVFALPDLKCKLCTAIRREAGSQNSSMWSQDDEFVILPTKHKKGHKFRYMIVFLYHLSENSVRENAQRRAKAELFSFMSRVCDDFYILGTDHATVKDHFHYVACSNDQAADDLALIEITNRIMVTEIKGKKTK